MSLWLTNFCSCWSRYPLFSFLHPSFYSVFVCVTVCLAAGGGTGSIIMFCRMLPLVSRLVEDPRPPLRAAVVAMCGDFCLWMGGKWSAILLDVMLCCFRDKEEAVRAAAVRAVPHAVLALVKTAAITADAAEREGGAREVEAPIASSPLPSSSCPSFLLCAACTATWVSLSGQRCAALCPRSWHCSTLCLEREHFRLFCFCRRCKSKCVM